MPDFVVLNGPPPAPGKRGGLREKVMTPKRQRTVNRVMDARRRGVEPHAADVKELEDTDLAVMVVRQTKQGLSSGDLTPTVKDGIAAQGILERRAERAADREFMLNLARALAGGGQQAPVTLLPDPTIIEGEVREVYAPSVPPRTDADDADLDADLAPAHLRQG